MTRSPLAGKPAPSELLVDVDRLLAAYAGLEPDPRESAQRVSFGTSGHRGSALDRTFNEHHILAITQAVCDYRARQGIDGPLFVAKDTHALSAPAERTALCVLAANAVPARVARDDGFTPTPALSHAILAHNRGRARGLADGIVVTPSHNPPRDGGFKYNPPHGGPADTDATSWIEARANALLEEGLRGVKRAKTRGARRPDGIEDFDYVTPYVEDLGNVLDLERVRAADVSIGVDPMGGAGLQYWEPIRARHGLRIEVVNKELDPTFAFMRVDHDGKIRMDCSSPAAMAGLVALKDRFDLACGNDADADRHGIVTPSCGLMNPNHYLAVAIDHLLAHRPGWNARARVGKTLVSSAMIDRVVAAHGRGLCETPVGFKWFVQGLHDGTFCFGGEESAGASFLRTDGTVWTTDKDGILLNLLAAEITACAGKDPGAIYRELTGRFGAPCYTRIDAPATPAEKAVLKALAPASVTATTLAGEAITARLTRAPGNEAPIGGLKVCAANGWFAARPSGTEDVYKIYAESFRDEAHLARIVDEAQAIVKAALADA